MPRNQEPAMTRTQEPAMPRNQEAGIASKLRAGNAPKPRSRHRPETKGPTLPQSQSVIAALSALPMQKTESRRNLHFSLRLSAISCLLSYMCFRLKETAVAVRPSADASASMIQSPD